MLRLNDPMTGNAQLAAQIEQLVLNFGEAVHHGWRQAGHREQHADGAVQLVSGAIRLDAGGVFSHARAVAQAGGAVVARPRVDLAEPVSHSR